MTDQNIFIREAGRLGIRIPRSAWKAAGHGVSAAMQQKGTLISHGQFSDWLADDLRQVDDEVVCFGPGFAGLSLEELLQSSLDETTMIQHLASVARALSRLDQEGGLPAGIQSAGVLVTADGDVLILPTSLVSRAAARTRRGEGPAPEGNLAIAASMMLAENLRRIFLHRFVNTPATPTNDNLPPRRESDPFVPLGLIAPHLDPGLAILADRCMNQTTVSPSLDDWANAFNPVGRKKYFRDLTADDLASLESQRKASETRVARRLAFKRFMTKRGGLLSGLAIALVIIAGIAIFDRPPPGPDLSALGPEALVEAYYSAISTLDLATLDACLEGKAGKDDRRDRKSTRLNSSH